MTEALTAQTLSLRAQHPDWGYRVIARKIGWDRHHVRRVIEKAERQKGGLVPAHSFELVTRVPEPRTAQEYAERICASWRASVESIIEVGRLLSAAKGRLEHGEFHKLIQEALPFGARTAQRLMQIGADARLSNATLVSHLPPSWGTLYEITKLDDAQFNERIADGTIYPEMERREIATAVKQTQRAKREQILGGIQHALPTKKYGVILADPEWRFEPWSRTTGMDRAADNHYPTSCTEVIASRDVASIAADDCVLFLWATVPMLPQALLVMGKWGFDYKSHIVWCKPDLGTGYWFRNQHELLLVGTRGKIPAPAMGAQWSSLRQADAGEHSEKPECFSELIEEYFPTLPKIELNRRGPPRENWDAWGNEAEAAA